jgi:hypothetical protein
VSFTQKNIVIAGREYRYRVLTLGDTIKAEELFGSMEATNPNEVTLKMSNEVVKDMLEFILVPIDKQAVDRKDFDQLSMQKIAQITGGFFLSIMQGVTSLSKSGND